MKLTTYKDFEIEVNERGQFFAEGIASTYDTLELLVKKIDDATRVKYKPQNVLYFTGGGMFERGPRVRMIGEITATRPHGHPDRKEFWTTDKNKTRSTNSGLIKDTAENRQIMLAVIALRNDADKLNAQAEDLSKNLDRNIVLEIA